MMSQKRVGCGCFCKADRQRSPLVGSQVYSNMVPTTFYHLVSEFDMQASRYSHVGYSFGEASFSILMTVRNKGKEARKHQ
jgi:hypothetical protein